VPGEDVPGVTLAGNSTQRQLHHSIIAGVRPAFTGNIVTVWQTALEDVGLLGMPGYKDPIPGGFTALPSDTIAVTRSYARH
jgi:hypothetical protein